MDKSIITLIDTICWNSQQLAPVIVQSVDTHKVLMLAWVSRQSLVLSLQEGRPVYWSRSRQCLWRKGETSGNTQKLMEAFVDCDKDALLFMVKQRGPACHTGKPDCFFRELPVLACSSE